MTLEEKLAEAEAVYHQLMLGQQIVFLQDQNGERIQYSKADLGKLAAYIADLKRQLGLTPTGPLNFWF
jgi:hypothetical protein